MKNLILLFLAFGLTMTACKKDDATDTGTTTSKDKLNPPAWIQGTWMDRSEPTMPVGYTFTTDDMLTIIANNSTSLNAPISDRNYSISETTTDSNYQFTITYTDTNSTESWIFNKMGDTQIQSIHGSVTSILTKE